MPKVSVGTKRKKQAQTGDGYTKHAEGPAHPLANRRARHRARLALVREVRRADP